MGTPSFYYINSGIVILGAPNRVVWLTGKWHEGWEQLAVILW